MSWIQRISFLEPQEKHGVYRVLIPPVLFHRFGIDPLTFSTSGGDRAVNMFCPAGDGACLIEIRHRQFEDPIYSLQLSDGADHTQLSWDFVIINDPDSPRFSVDVDDKGRDTLFGWAARNVEEECRALAHGYFPGQIRKGLGLTGQVIRNLEFFCRMLDIKSIRLEALFYHNAISYEQHGFSYFSGYKMMNRINEGFRPGGCLAKLLDGRSTFRHPDFARTVRGRSWALHDGILAEADDEILEEGWVSPVMYRMVGSPRAMVTFPDPVF
jgi:hypothetical protein